MKFLALQALVVFLVQYSAVLAKYIVDDIGELDMLTAAQLELLDQRWESGRAGRVDTCSLQKDAIKFTVEEINDARCLPGHAYLACLTLNLHNRPTVDKTCVKDPEVMSPPDFSVFDNLTFWSDHHVGLAVGGEYRSPPDLPVVNGSTQCQRGCSGGTLLFSLVDGYRCKPTPASGQPDFAEIRGITTLTGHNLVSIQCRSRAGWNAAAWSPVGAKIGSCTCVSDYSECIWVVGLPVFQYEISPLPSPSPSCACPPDTAECSKEIAELEYVGYTNGIDILNCTSPQDVADIINQKGPYGCAISKVPGCRTITCERLVPPEILVNFYTCPVPSPSPEQ